ncbi:MAG: ribulose-phosphate 3-epimerase [Candidatus Kerfeldbacteria bacterium]|nr:ribulose-phosphate 3-epimerase [Candidatus Kerfeldbacteria bacterium]
MIQVQPAILEKDINEIQRKLNLVKGVCNEVHLDVMDGEFVPNTTVNDAQAVAELDWGNLQVSLHLMINHPDLFLRKWAFPQVSTIFVHREAVQNMAECIRLIKGLEKKIGLAINPHTPTYDVKEFLHEVDAIMVMAVEPGWSAQAFNADVLEKISYLRSLKPTLSIVVDGGVNAVTKADIIKAGASIVCSNSYIFQSKDIAAAIANLQQ